MPYRNFTLSFRNLPPTNFWREKFNQTDPQAVRKENQKPISLDYLSKFADKNAWYFAPLHELSQGQSKADNLYLVDILGKSNDFNSVFEYVRGSLLNEGRFAFKVITAENTKLRLQQEFNPIIFPVYYFFYFLIRRFFPKVKVFKKLCMLLSMPVDRSKGEIVGRLVYKGFKVIEIVEADHETLIITEINLTENPSAIIPAPCEGFIFKMNRLGKSGNKIIVYKLRTMHPYAEYAQDYIHKVHGLDVGGKFKNDFRVSVSGRLLRKYWIDEIPMLYNLIKGDIKLVGVRPISEYYFSLYPENIQTIRKKHKPGLLPPFYADMPKTFDEIVQSELTYLTKYEASPLQTDLTYLGKIVKNIVIHKARSK